MQFERAPPYLPTTTPIHTLPTTLTLYISRTRRDLPQLSVAEGLGGPFLTLLSVMCTITSSLMLTTVGNRK